MGQSGGKDQLSPLKETERPAVALLVTGSVPTLVHPCALKDQVSEAGLGVRVQ